MKKAVTAFFMAWGMFCAIPCPLRRWDKSLYRGMLLALPFLGLLIGGLWALCAWLLRLLDAPVPFSAALLAALPLLLSGFIHLDGYMDCADAILSRRDLETRRKILKDSHVGSFAVICLGLLLLLTHSLFAGADLEGREWGLLFIPAVSRCCSAWAVLRLPPLETSGYAGMEGKAGAVTAAAVMTAVFALLPLVFLRPWGLCGLVTAAGSWLTIALCRRNLGGMSGDISGAGITVGELCGVAALTLF